MSDDHEPDHEWPWRVWSRWWVPVAAGLAAVIGAGIVGVVVP